MLPLYYPQQDQYLIELEETQLTLIAHRAPAAETDQAVLYRLEILVNGRSLSFGSERTASQSYPREQTFTLNMIHALSEALDDWGQMYPYTVWTLSHRDLNQASPILKRYGFIGDAYGEQWFTFYGMKGQQIVFEGVLNLVSHQLFYAPFLWRIAKYSDYYLGDLPSPEDSEYQRLLEPERSPYEDFTLEDWEDFDFEG